MSQTPFPTVFEIIRFIAIGFDTKASNKQLDDLARDVFSDYRQVEPMLEQVLIVPLSKYVSPQFANTFSSGIQKMLTDYLELVSLKSVDGISRGQVLPVLVSHWFVTNALKVLTCTFTQLHNMPSAFLLLGNANPAIGNVLEWASDHVEGWTESISTLPKEKKDQLSNWQKGKYLPGLQSLHLFMAEDVGQSIPQEARERLMGLLVLARAVDSLRSLPLGDTALDEARQQLVGAQSIGNPYKLFESYQQDARLRVEPIWPHLGYLSNHLRRTTSKSQEVQSESRKCLDDLTIQLKALSEYETSKHKVAQLEGRWHVFSGDLKAACKHYALAVEAALYRAGNKLGGILEEAFCVAAKANNTVLMRNVKNSQIMFKVDLESVNQQLVAKPSKKTEQFLQDWEVMVWSKQFEKTFPNEGLFLGVAGYEHAEKLGVITYSTKEEIKPDYRYPDRKIKIGYKAKKTWPQICWFIHQSKIDVVNKLIQKGVRIDVEASSGDTPLIMALEKLALLDNPLGLLVDDRYWLALLDCPGIEKMVNKQSQKVRLTPVIQAVKASRLDIVEKLLELGADVDLRGDTDGQTALNVCIKLIGVIKKPDEWLKTQLNCPDTPELWDAIRRHSNGVFGANLSSQKAIFEIPEMIRELKRQTEQGLEKFLKQTSLKKMREILRVLLRAGANPNLTFQSPRPDYTPTMLAAELDLKEELEIMLTYEADLNKSSKIPMVGGEETSWDIAKRCQSIHVLRLMEDISPYYAKY